MCVPADNIHSLRAGSSVNAAYGRDEPLHGLDLGPPKSYRDRRPSHAEPVGDLGLTQTIDKCQAGDGSLTLGQAFEQIRQCWRHAGQEVVGLGPARDDQEAFVTISGRLNGVPSMEKRRTRALRCRTIAGIDAAFDTHPPNRPPRRAQGRAQHGDERVRIRREETLQLVTLSEPEGSQPFVAVRDVQLVHESTQPIGRRRGVSPRPDYVAEQNQCRNLVHARRLTWPLIADNVYSWPE